MGKAARPRTPRETRSGFDRQGENRKHPLPQVLEARRSRHREAREESLATKANSRVLSTRSPVGRDDLGDEGAWCRDQCLHGTEYLGGVCRNAGRCRKTVGDVAMLENEVTPVLKALRKNGLDVVAIHNHMTPRSPCRDLPSLLGQRTGRETCMRGFKAALDELGKGTPGHEMAH